VEIVVGLVIAAIVIVVVIVGLWLLKSAVDKLIQLQAQKAQISQLDPLLAELQPGKSAIVYFTGAWCGPCKLVQTPVIQQLAQERGDSLQIIEVDINENMDTAQRWGVMKVPRTFVLDRNLHIYASNLDVAMLHTLKQQLDESELHAAAPQPMKLVRQATGGH
jgi:thiol-disulfide isomerase/thioredoxin